MKIDTFFDSISLASSPARLCRPSPQVIPVVAATCQQNRFICYPSQENCIVREHRKKEKLQDLR